jgi:hypothetical protein
MSDLEKDVLRILRVFGPCSNAAVGRRLKIPPDKTYRAICSLCVNGLAVHPKLQRWDISRLGREWFEKQENRPLALYASL